MRKNDKWIDKLIQNYNGTTSEEEKEKIVEEIEEIQSLEKASKNYYHVNDFSDLRGA